MIVNLQDLGITRVPYTVEITFFNIIDYHRFRKYISPHFPRFFNKDTVVLNVTGIIYDEPIAKVKFKSKTARETLGKSLSVKDYVKILDHALKRVARELIDFEIH